MHDTITLTGLVATPPRHIVTAEKVSITSFRLASTARRLDKESSRWVDGETNWYTVSAYRYLADNTAVSVQKGDRVLITGRLKVRAWEKGERSGTTVDVDADVIGHDLTWGTARYSRTVFASRSSQSGDGDRDTGEFADPDGGAADLAEPAPEGALVPSAPDTATPF